MGGNVRHIFLIRHNAEQYLELFLGVLYIKKGIQTRFYHPGKRIVPIQLLKLYQDLQME
jgi:hypothetical protein